MFGGILCLSVEHIRENYVLSTATVETDQEDVQDIQKQTVCWNMVKMKNNIKLVFILLCVIIVIGVILRMYLPSSGR